MDRLLTKNKFAYETLKDKIMSGELLIGDRLTIRDVSKDLGISDTPVREALSRLESEGYIKIIPHVGATVCGVNLQEFEEIIVLRSYLEHFAICLVTPKNLAPVIDELGNILEKMRIEYLQQNHQKYYNLVKKFSFVLFSCCKNKVLYNLLYTFWSKTEIMRSIYHNVPESNNTSFEAYNTVYNLLKENKIEEAASCFKKYKTILHYGLLNKIKELHKQHL